MSDTESDKELAESFLRFHQALVRILREESCAVSWGCNVEDLGVILDEQVKNQN